MLLRCKMLLRSRCCYLLLLRWRCCYVEYAVTFMYVVTFKMLLRWRCCYLEDVVALKMLLRWRCCCVEDVVRLKMLLHPRCCYVENAVALKMLLRWRCCYVEDVVVITNAFKTALWMWREKSLMCISPMVLWWIMTFLCLSKETWNSKKHAIPMESTAKMIQWWTLKRFKTTLKQRTTYPRYVVRMLN